MPTDRDRRQRASAETVQPLRMLVVDDDPNYRAYVAALARRFAFWVDTVEDGHAAVERLRQGQFDVVIVDHEMPRLTGESHLNARRDGTRILRAMLAARFAPRARRSAAALRPLSPR